MKKETKAIRTTICTECKIVLRGQSAHQTQFPCPNCGSKRKTLVVRPPPIKAGASMSGNLKVTRPRVKKPLIESKAGLDLHRASGRYYDKVRFIDRQKDLYRELITEPKTGVIIHQCEEPLSKHRGHGSAKYKRD